jgi:hypothetical protein
LHVSIRLLDHLVLPYIKLLKEIREINDMDKPTTKRAYVIENAAGRFLQDFGWPFRDIRWPTR